MTPPFHRVRELFEQACELPAEQHATFVRNAAGGDEQLATEVLKLLQLAPPRDQDKVQSTATDALLQKLESSPRIDTKRYVFEGEIDRGGMGAVLRIHDSHLNRRLAMKVMLEREAPSDEHEARLLRQLLGRFLEEAQVTSQLDHPGVVPVHELGLDASGKVYFTMRLVKGRNASEVFLLARESADGWTRTRALEVVLKVCDTMAYAHEKGVLHRDLKPANVMVGRFGEVYVMDWGLAKVLGEPDRHDLRIVDQKLVPSSVVDTARQRDAGSDGGSPVMTMGGQKLGTPSYMSPEQARSEEVDERADVYSVGAMLYELLTGRAPYTVPGQSRRAYDVLEDVVDKPPKRIEEITKDVPAELVAIVEKAMNRNCAQRYATVLDLAADVRAFLDQRVVRAYRTGALIETRLWMRRNRALAGSLFAAAVLLVAGVFGTTMFAVRADERAEELEWNTYVANVQMASKCLQTSADDTARELLGACPERHRGWEWRCLRAESDRSLLLLQHDGQVRSAAFSADGMRVLTVCSDERVRIWDATTGACLRQLEPVLPSTGWIGAAALSPDGKHVVTASSDGIARVWDARSGRRLLDLRGHTAVLTSASFSPDSQRLLTASRDGTVRIWDVADGTALLELRRTQGASSTPVVAHMESAAFSSDGRRVLTTSADGTICLWDGASGACLVELAAPDRNSRSALLTADGTRVLSWHGQTTQLWDVVKDVSVGELDAPWTRAAAASPDGQRLVTGAGDGTVRVWNALNGGRLFELIADQVAISSVSFSSDGLRILAAASDGDVRIWDANSGACLAPLKTHATELNMAAFSPDGIRLVTASNDRTACVWDAGGLRSSELWQRNAAWGVTASFTPDGTRVLTLSGERVARIWDVTSGASLAELAPTRDGMLLTGFEGLLVSFSADGARVAIGSCQGTARIWDATNGACLAELRGHTDWVRSVSFDPSGTRVVTGSADQTARIWDTSGRASLELRGHRGSVSSAAFSPDGRHVVTASSDRTARVWDAATGDAVAVLEGHRASVLFARFSPDGGRVLTASMDGTACLWDPLSGARLLELAGHRDGVYAASFSSDGTRVVTGGEDTIARVWNATTGSCIAELRGHRAMIISASFNPDGTRVVTASHDGTTRVWDAATGVALADLKVGGKVQSVAFSPDGSVIVTGSADCSARLWRATPFRERIPAIRRMREAVAFMAPRVTPRLDAGEDQLVVRKWIQSDAALTPEQRTAGQVAVQAWLDAKAEKEANDKK